MNLVSSRFPINPEPPEESALDPVGVSGVARPDQRARLRQRDWQKLPLSARLSVLASFLALVAFCPLAVLAYVAARINQWMILVVVAPALGTIAYLMFGPPSELGSETNIVVAKYPFLQSAAISLDIAFSLVAGLTLYARYRAAGRPPAIRHTLACLTLILSVAANYPLHSLSRLQADQAYATISSLAMLKDRITRIKQLEDSPSTRESLRIALLAANHAIGKPPPRAQETAAAFRMLISASVACTQAGSFPGNAACALAEQLIEPCITQPVPRSTALMAMLDPRRAILRDQPKTPAEEFLVSHEPAKLPGTKV